jgi:hypothetical protein
LASPALHVANVRVCNCATNYLEAGLCRNTSAEKIDYPSGFVALLLKWPAKMNYSAKYSNDMIAQGYEVPRYDSVAPLKIPSCKRRSSIVRGHQHALRVGSITGGLFATADHSLRA